MRRFVVVVALSLIVSWTYAQAPSNIQLRKMNLLAIELLDNYELYAGLSDKRSKHEFKMMFDREDATTFCDLYHNADFYSKQMLIDEYISFIEDTNTRISRVQLSNIKRDEIWYSQGMWHYSLTFDKEINYFDNNGVMFPVGVDSNGEDAKEKYPLKMTLVFDSSVENVWIRSLEANSNNTFNRPKKTIIVQKNDYKNHRFEEAITSGNQHLRYNSVDQAVVLSHDFNHPNDDVWMSYETIYSDEVYEVIKLDYKISTLRIKSRSEIASMAYSFSYNPNNYKSQSVGYSLGIDLGVEFALGDITKCGFYIGAAYTESLFSVYSDNISSYTLPVYSNDRRRIKRQYSIDDISQRARFKDVVIPVYFDLTYKPNTNLYLLFDLGAKAYLNIETNIDNAIATGSVNGEKFKSVYIDNTTNTSISRDISLFCSTGAGFTIVPRRIYLEGKIGYEQSFGLVQFSSESGLIKGNYPVIYNGLTGEDLLTGSLLYNTSMRRRMLWLSLGLKFKF